MIKMNLVNAIVRRYRSERSRLKSTGIRTAIQQANAPRKSVKIGLSGAYDWSNPNIRDDVLIGKVLEKHKFEDVARLCFFYGVPKVKRVFKRRTFDPMTSESVARMLSNISKGLRASPELAHA